MGSTLYFMYVCMYIHVYVCILYVCCSVASQYVLLRNVCVVLGYKRCDEGERREGCTERKSPQDCGRISR